MQIFYLLFVVFLALFHAAQSKKCCNHDCTQVISQGRSFREYFPTEEDELPLERDVKVWVFMKEMGVNEEGAEMWYGESRGKRGYFPNHWIGEYMVLCRDLVEIDETEQLRFEATSEENREHIPHPPPPENTDVYTEENYETDSDSDGDTQEEHAGIPDLVSEWRMKVSPPEAITERESDAHFHLPDTDAMKALKRQMDQDFLNRILEAEGVDRIDEIDPERLSEIIQDPGAARIVLEALQELRETEDREMSYGGVTPGEITRNEEIEVILERDRNSREISQPEIKPVEAEPLPSQEDTNRETSHPEVEPVEPEPLPSQEDSNRETSHPEVEPVEPEPLPSQEDTNRETSHPEVEPVEPEHWPSQGNTNRETSHPEVEPVEPEPWPSQEDTSIEFSQTETSENPPNEYTDTVDTPSEGDPSDEIREIPPPGTEDESNEPEREFSQPNEDTTLLSNTDEDIPYNGEGPREISHPEEPADDITHGDKLFGIIPSPLSDIIRHYIQTYGVFYISVYTLIPLVIAHLYVGRRAARNQISAHQFKSASHVKILEQKVVSLQKEKKALEGRIAKFDTLKEANAASQEELNSLRINFNTSKQELADSSQLIARLECQTGQLNGELLALQEGMGEQIAKVSRLETLNTSAQEEILSMKAQVDIVNGNLQQADTEKMTLQLRLDANIDSFAQLKETLSGVEKNRDEVGQKKNRLQEDLKQKEATISANSERIYTLEGEIEVLTNSLLKLQPIELGISTTNDTERNSIFETLTNTAKALSELEQATTSRDKYERHNQTLTSENVALKTRAEDLDDNLSCLKSNNILLKKQLGDSDTKLQVLNEYFNTKESELHRQLNESRNSQLLLEGKDHRSLEEIDAVRSERESLKSEISSLKQQHTVREKSLLEQISSLEKRVQDSLYNSRRNEQELRGRDREITDLKRKIGESSLPSPQTETYLSPRSTSPSSQLSSNSDTEARGDKNRGTQSPSQAQFASTGAPLPNFTSGPPTRTDIPSTGMTTHAKPSPMPGYLPGYMPANFYRPAPYPPVMAQFPHRIMMPPNMQHFNSPTVKHKPNTRPSLPTDEHTEPTITAMNNRPLPGLYAPSPPTLIDTSSSNEYIHEESSQGYNGSLLDSHNQSSLSLPTETRPFNIDV